MHPDALLGFMDCSPFPDVDSSAVPCQPLHVEPFRSCILSRNKLDCVIRSKHPGQADCNSLKPRVKHDSILSRVVRNDSIYGQKKVHKPALADGMERTPAHLDSWMSDCEPNFGDDVSPD